MALRAVLSRLIAEVPELSLALARKLSALDVSYPAGGHPLTGTRVPEHVAQLRHARPVLLVTAAAPIQEAAAAAAKRGIDVVTAPLPWTTAAVVLVRPDGHVWWAADEADDQRIAAALDDVGYRREG
jgi:hypothetical protein